jgi:predicted DNA-binding transcriptional regulator AlpA
MYRATQTYLPAAQVRARYGVSDMSLWRWIRDEALGFPHPLRINGRRFWKLTDLEAWEASCANQGEQEVTHARTA